MTELHVGAQIRGYRERAGLTQRQLSERSGVSAPYIALIELGKRRPSLVALGKLSTGLGCTRREHDALVRSVRAAGVTEPSDGSSSGELLPHKFVGGDPAAMHAVAAELREIADRQAQISDRLGPLASKLTQSWAGVAAQHFVTALEAYQSELKEQSDDFAVNAELLSNFARGFEGMNEPGRRPEGKQ